MSLRKEALGARAIVVTLIAFAIGSVLAAPSVVAQTTTPEPVQVGVTTAPQTSTPTRTPAPTSTATPTLTARQGQLLLAQTYLDGGAYAEAAVLFAGIAKQNPGDPTAVPGLKAALKMQATATGAAQAPKPTAPPLAPTPGPTFGSVFGQQLGNFSSTGLAALVLVLLLYFASKLVRWLFIQLREIWWTRTDGLFSRMRQEPVPPGYYVGEFVDATGETNFPGGRVAAQILTEGLVQWHQAVMPDAPSVEPIPGLDLSGMSWVKVLWNWILPPPRVLKITGILLGRANGPYELAISRTSLVKNRVEASQTFGPIGGASVSPEQAVRELVAKALSWILDPLAAAAMDAAERAPLAAKGLESAERAETSPAAHAPTQAMQDAMRSLILARQQIARQPTDKTAVRGHLDDAQQALEPLPADSALRADLQRAIDELRSGM